MATACLNDNVAALEQLERDYIAQHFELPPGQKRPSADQVSGQFRHNLQAVFRRSGGRGAEAPALPVAHPDLARPGLAGPRWTLAHAAGLCRGLCRQCGAPQGAGWLAGPGGVFQRAGRRRCGALPFDTGDFRSHQAELSRQQLHGCAAGQLLHSVCAAPGARHRRRARAAPIGMAASPTTTCTCGTACPRRRRWCCTRISSARWCRAGSTRPGSAATLSSPALDNMLVLAPDPAWVRRLPNGACPTAPISPATARIWPGASGSGTGATSAAQQLADEFAQWLEKPDLSQIEPL